MKFYFLFLFYYIFEESFSLNTECDLKQTKYGFVCQCTEKYCDYFEDPKPKDVQSWIAITSSESGLRFSKSEGTFKNSHVIKDYTDSLYNSKSFDSSAISVDRSIAKIYGPMKKITVFKSQQLKTSTISINREKRYQKVVGFGGALTGTVSYLLENLKPQLQNHILRSYFHKDGIAFNMIRISIGGCDFDLEPWAYNEEPKNDKDLTNFQKLDNRDLQKLSQIEKIKELRSQGNDLKIMAAAWSPPKWMKSNEDWTGFSYLKPEYYQTWADYHLRFLQLMYAKNIKIWAISTGNEPLNGVIGWFFVKFMSLGWTPRNQAIYLNDFLGPTLRKSQFKNVLIFGNDDQRYTYPQWFQKMNASRPTALNYLDGLAVHWYWDDIFGPELIDKTLQSMPGKLLINTEACVGDKPWQTHGPELGSWTRAEQYITDIMQDLQHNFNGWIDWNLVLDENGGPNYVNNTVDAAIIINTKNNSEFYKQPIFYAIGHFSKFIPEGSQRIEITVNSVQNSIDAVAFQRPDDSVVVVVFNSLPIPQDIVFNDNLRGVLNLNVPPRSIHSIVYL